MIIVTARAKAKKGKENELQSELMEVARMSRKEKGCVSYHLHCATHDSSMVLTYEVWKDGSHIQDHMNAAHVKNLITKIPVLCDGMPEILTWSVID